MVQKVDKIIKNAKVFTSNKKNLYCTSLAIKDGKFVYVGDEVGLKDFEGDMVDYNGKFIMPAIMDSHVHITVSIANMYVPPFEFVFEMGKEACLKHIEDFVKANPSQNKYNFLLSIENLGTEKLTKDDIDKICSDKEVLIAEHGCHSVWVNSKLLEKVGVTEDTKDIVPGLSYYERDEKGHLTGYLVEMTEASLLMSHVDDITDEQIEAGLKQYFDYCVKEGVSSVFDAGLPGAAKFHERVYRKICEMDKKGEVPIYIDGCYMTYTPDMLNDAVSHVKEYNKEFNTKHLKVDTLKIISDGTIGVYTAALCDPYQGKTTNGGCVFTPERLKDLLKELNENNLNIHIHTCGERASMYALDGIELAKKELGDKFKIKVTLAHLEIMRDEDLHRFKELNVLANYTPWWHGGGGGGGGLEGQCAIMGKKRGTNMYKCRTVYDSGATVCFSSDNVMFMDFVTWSPYLGIEIAMTRYNGDKTRVSDAEKIKVHYPPDNEKMEFDQALISYTLNNAYQMGYNKNKGSIEVGKDADYLVFDEDLSTTEKEGFSNVMPKEYYLEGVKKK